MPTPSLQTDVSDARHSKEDALSEREFEQLLEATYSLDEPHDLEARFVVITAGRLGLRAGEIVHLREDWLDWQTRRIEIPGHEPCVVGRGDSICGLCEQAAIQETQVHNRNVGRRWSAIMDRDRPHQQRDFDAGELTVQDVATAREHRWQPKTDAAVRGIPVDFSTRIEMVLEQFLDRWSRWPYSYQTARRRLHTAAEAAPGLSDDDVYLHALRSTSASFHAGRGLDSLALRSLHGWTSLSTAEKYVSGSDTNTQRALRAVHSR